MGWTWTPQLPAGNVYRGSKARGTTSLCAVLGLQGRTTESVHCHRYFSYTMFFFYYFTLFLLCHVYSTAESCCDINKLLDSFPIPIHSTVTLLWFGPTCQPGHPWWAMCWWVCGNDSRLLRLCGLRIHMQTIAKQASVNQTKETLPNQLMS